MNLGMYVDKNTVTAAMRQVGRNLDFATSQALNAVANDGQSLNQQRLPSRFTLRRPDFIKRTIKRTRDDFATKAKLVAIVRVDPERDMLAKFEDGGPKTPREGQHITIPTTNVRRTKYDIVAKAQRPRMLLNSKAAQSGRVWKGPTAILQSVGRGRSRVTRALYLLVRAVRIRPRLRLYGDMAEAVDRKWKQRANEALERAVFSTNERTLG